MRESKNQRSLSSMITRQSVSTPAHWSMEQWVEYLDEKFARHHKECTEGVTQMIASIKEVEEKMTTQGQEILKLQELETEREEESTAMALEISILQNRQK
ncbi:hypothetical protein scyTo_0010716 [Scyliorhinus torazame]|uniref:Uncharacterized protein n=1 Tax=Scyliorhinus torazame TaxID=75743 RepID=A0A401PAL8_SCYTO|nr:hypothetical protein [Scyliorhinus torazame]